MRQPTVAAFVSNEKFVTVLVISADVDSHITVYRRYAGDTEIVRGAEDVPMRGDEQLFIDYEVPQGVPITYWCVATEGAESSESEHVVTAPYDFGGDVIFDLGDPKRGMLVDVESFDQYKYGISRDVQRVWGRRDPVVISGVREMFASSLNVVTLESKQRDNLLAIIENGSTIAMSVRSPIYGLSGVLYFAVGDVDENRLNGAIASEPARRWNLNIQQISPPPAQYRYPSYGLTWAQMREQNWSVYKDDQWWQRVAQ